jgi:hypothetical protein
LLVAVHGVPDRGGLQLTETVHDQDRRIVDTGTAKPQASSTRRSSGSPAPARSSAALSSSISPHGTDCDRAADYLNQAVDALQADRHGTGLDRIRAVRPVLGVSRHGVHLDDRAVLTASWAALPGG